MPKFKFPVGSSVIWHDSSSKLWLRIVGHDLANDTYRYSYQTETRQYPYPRGQMERLYKIYSELQTFKFPINSLISWNKDPDNIQFRVTGYNYSADLYNLIIEKYNRDDMKWSQSIKVGYRFDFDRKITEEEHSLVKPKVEFKFPIGSRIQNKKDGDILIVEGYNWHNLKDVYAFTGGTWGSIEWTENNYELIEEKPKFKVGDVIIRRQNKNCSNPHDFTYTILYIDAVDILTAYDRNNMSVKRSVSWLDDFEIYKPKIPKCIPADPAKSGWHWISSKGWTDSRSTHQPRWWDAEKQMWAKKGQGTLMKSAITPEEAHTAQWVYHKPCEY